jgi:phage FluMu protein Com
MRIITLECDDCGSIVAGNVLERYYRVDCPGVNCDCIYVFDDLSEEERTYLREHSEEYRMD